MKIVSNILYSILLFFILPIAGCEVECRNVVCFNEGRCFKGTCQCPEDQFNRKDYLNDCREVKGYLEGDWISSVQGCSRYPESFELSKLEKIGTYSISNAFVQANEFSGPRSFNNGSQLSITSEGQGNEFTFLINLRDDDNNEIFYSGTYVIGQESFRLSYESSNLDQWGCGANLFKDYDKIN